MSYYKVLDIAKEPFSTSPDPEFFYLSKEHESALTNILIELRLKRGLSVILGDVGTGKTTLSRKLIQELKEREDFIFQIILDPSFENENVFLTSLARNFDIAINSDAVLLDIRLGGKKSGLDLLREIRLQDGLTPVIMTTRYDDVDTVVTAVKAGANDYLHKPIRLAELNIRLEKVLEEIQIRDRKSVV